MIKIIPLMILITILIKNQLGKSLGPLEFLPKQQKTKRRKKITTKRK